MHPIEQIRSRDFVENYLKMPSICLTCRKNDIEEWDDKDFQCIHRQKHTENTIAECAFFEPLF